MKIFTTPFLYGVAITITGNIVSSKLLINTGLTIMAALIVLLLIGLIYISFKPRT